jgi:hypothetical protein
MSIIDLHGIKHEDVSDIIIDACSKNETPFMVITGRSSRMKRIVSFAAAKFSLTIRDAINNPGRVIVDVPR